MAKTWVVNVLRFSGSAAMDEQFDEPGAQAARSCLQEASLALSDVDIIVASPARYGYRAALAAKRAVPVERITVADDESMHITTLVSALSSAAEQLSPAARVLLIAAGAGVTAGAALYRQALHPA
jgi:3-oxoacyl-[acyl-carrier-protein] synthase III